jgi:hypothetical protein
MAKGKSPAGPLAAAAIIAGLGFWLYNAKLGAGGGPGIGGGKTSVIPTGDNNGSKSEPVKATEPAPTPASASLPTKAAVSIQVDPASNTVRYVLEKQTIEPGKFQEQLKLFLEKNPSIKEIILTFPQETPAADVLAVQQAISSFPGVTYTVTGK